MRAVFKRLDERVTQLERRPLFAFLADRTIDSQRRLSFAPFVAHFVMSFADLYAFVLFEEPAKDKYQELVNAHTREDANHWRWFLADLEKLGSDPHLAFSDALRAVWGRGTVRMRSLTYEMCRLGYKADSLSKLVLVHCIEAAGKVTIRHVGAVGNEFAAATHKRLVYFGQHHSDTEAEHTLEDAKVHQGVEGIVLEPDKERALLPIVDQSFDAFTGFIDEMLDLAKSGRGIAEP